MKANKKPVRPVILTVAGNDSAGMAGMSMDIKTQSSLGVHTLPVITANTAQNNEMMLAINPVSGDVLESQLKAATQIPIDCMKVGLICNSEQIAVIRDYAEKLMVPLVLDPVLSATSGGEFSEKKTWLQLKKQLLPLCTLITPNIKEASALTNLVIRNTGDMEQAARKLLSLGAKNVLLKGGHLGGKWSQDFFCNNESEFWLSSKRIDSVNTRGTGCALASAIASSLTHGYPMKDAVVIGKMAINQGLRLGYSTETDKGPVSIQAFPDKQIDLPCLTQTADFNFDRAPFPSCQTNDEHAYTLGLYPVVDGSHWLERLLPLGISTAQVRIKNRKGEELEKEIKKSIEIAQKYNCRLFINDYWQLAIKHGAYGVHLGQEDLDTADIDAILNSGLKLGTSTHCHYEVARAHSYKPSYIACGPVYHTNTKQMPWVPHGLNGLSYWQKVLNYPLVAIGGINQERFAAVRETGVDGIAMITAITLADDPEQTTRNFIKMINNDD